MIKFISDQPIWEARHVEWLKWYCRETAHGVVYGKSHFCVLPSLWVHCQASSGRPGAAVGWQDQHLGRSGHRVEESWGWNPLAPLHLPVTVSDLGAHQRIMASAWVPSSKCPANSSFGKLYPRNFQRMWFWETKLNQVNIAQIPKVQKPSQVHKNKASRQRIHLDDKESLKQVVHVGTILWENFKK